jgi:hypothetical protein
MFKFNVGEMVVPPSGPSWPPGEKEDEVVRIVGRRCEVTEFERMCRNTIVQYLVCGGGGVKVWLNEDTLRSYGSKQQFTVQHSELGGWTKGAGFNTRHKPTRFKGREEAEKVARALSSIEEADKISVES